MSLYHRVPGMCFDGLVRMPFLDFGSVNGCFLIFVRWMDGEQKVIDT